MKLKLYDNTETYIYPSGVIATPEKIKQDYPATELFPHVIEVNGHVLQAINDLESLKETYNVVEADPIKAIELIELKQKEFLNIIPEPTAEERIAAALEFDNLLKL